MFLDKFKHASPLSILVEALMCIFFLRSRRALCVQRVGVHCQVFHVTRDLVLKSNLRSDFIIDLARAGLSRLSSFAWIVKTTQMRDKDIGSQFTYIVLITMVGREIDVPLKIAVAANHVTIAQSSKDVFWLLHWTACKNVIFFSSIFKSMRMPNVE